MCVGACVCVRWLRNIYLLDMKQTVHQGLLQHSYNFVPPSPKLSLHSSSQCKLVIHKILNLIIIVNSFKLL